MKKIFLILLTLALTLKTQAMKLDLPEGMIFEMSPGETQSVEQELQKIEANIHDNSGDRISNVFKWKECEKFLKLLNRNFDNFSRFEFYNFWTHINQYNPLLENSYFKAITSIKNYMDLFEENPEKVLDVIGLSSFVGITKEKVKFYAVKSLLEKIFKILKCSIFTYKKQNVLNFLNDPKNLKKIDLEEFQAAFHLALLFAEDSEVKFKKALLFKRIEKDLKEKLLELLTTDLGAKELFVEEKALEKHSSCSNSSRGLITPSIDIPKRRLNTPSPKTLTIIPNSPINKDVKEVVLTKKEFAIPTVIKNSPLIKTEKAVESQNFVNSSLSGDLQFPLELEKTQKPEKTKKLKKINSEQSENIECEQSNLYSYNLYKKRMQNALNKEKKEEEQKNKENLLPEITHGFFDGLFEFEDL